MIAAFTVGGATWGVVARVWMRLVSADPEFSWEGTLLIVALFTVAGAAQGLALAVRRRRWPRWAQAPFRVVAGFSALLLGGGAGIVMLPTLVAGSLALARSGWPRAVRGVLVAIVTINVVAIFPLLLADLSWLRSLVGWVLMVPLYGVVVWAISLNLRRHDDAPLLRQRRAV